MGMDDNVFYKGILKSISHNKDSSSLEIEVDDGEIESEIFGDLLNKDMIGHKITFQSMNGVSRGRGWGYQKIVDHDNNDKEYVAKFGS